MCFVPYNSESNKNKALTNFLIARQQVAPINQYARCAIEVDIQVKLK